MFALTAQSDMYPANVDLGARFQGNPDFTDQAPLEKDDGDLGDAILPSDALSQMAASRSDIASVASAFQAFNEAQGSGELISMVGPHQSSIQNHLEVVIAKGRCSKAKIFTRSFIARARNRGSASHTKI